MFQLFDMKGNNVIEFGEFVRSLSVFHPDASIDEKARCELFIHYMTCWYILATRQNEYEIKNTATANQKKRRKKKIIFLTHIF